MPTHEPWMDWDAGAVLRAPFDDAPADRREELEAILRRVLPLAESWADGVGASHPDHDVIAEARAALGLK